MQPCRTLADTLWYTLQALLFALLCNCETVVPSYPTAQTLGGQPLHQAAVRNLVGDHLQSEAPASAACNVEVLHVSSETQQPCDAEVLNVRSETQPCDVPQQACDIPQQPCDAPQCDPVLTLQLSRAVFLGR